MNRHHKSIKSHKNKYLIAYLRLLMTIKRL